METAFIQTPLGITKLEGDTNGLTSITVLDTDETLTDIIPPDLE